MTWTELTAPPRLELSDDHLDAAAAAVDRASAHLHRAGRAEWVSVAADAYRAQLADMEERVWTLARNVDACRDHWAAARIAASQWGQL